MTFKVTDRRIKAEDVVPPHDYIVGGTGACLICGRTEFDAMHVPPKASELVEGLRESLPNADEDLKETAADEVADDDDDSDEEGQTGVMVALFPSQEVAQQLRLPGGEKAKNIHLTLAYLGNSDEIERPEALLAAVTEFAAREGTPLTGEVAGLGIFTAGEGKVTYASVDLPGLPAFRQSLVQVLAAAGFPPSETHGFTPHMTLAYADKRTAEVPNLPLHFDSIVVAIAGKRHVIPLGGGQSQEGEYSFTMPEPAAEAPKTGILRGWFGAPNTEKAETFYFEHDWKPVPGHPAEVATCDVCGLNRWSDEHAAAALVCKDCGQQYFTDNAKDPKHLNCPESAGLYKSHKYLSPNGEQPEGVQSRGAAGYGYAYPPCATCGLTKDDPVHAGADKTDVTDGTNSGGTTKPGAGAVAGTRYQTAEREEPTYEAPKVDAQKAFIADLNGRTLITAPASLDTHGWEKALTPNPHFMWMQGRFVGGEAPNRNKAFWSTEDLEMGEPTVAHGPLNWLHESRHIIGTIADQKLIKPSAEQAAEGNVPYIAAVAGVWKWIYPDEAWVVEQASDAGKLWYSMECISDRVECVGDNGCGASASYSDYMKNTGKACAHMKERSSVRRFVDPTFLGGAVIVPPVRPGWADADARVMAEAASLAEKSFAQVHPDATASEWELLMAQVVKFARP